MTEKEHLRILSLIHDLLQIALPVGSLHSYWEVIMDMQAFTEGRRTVIQHTAQEWIIYAEKLLGK